MTDKLVIRCAICGAIYQSDGYKVSAFCDDCLTGMTHYMRQDLLSRVRLTEAVNRLAQMIEDTADGIDQDVAEILAEDVQGH